MQFAQQISAMAASPALWSIPPERVRLSINDVHVWRAHLNQPESTVEQLFGTLAADERSRAERFYFQKDQKHFIVARGILRAILSRYLSIKPEKLRFSYNEYGKPDLNQDIDRCGLRFNLSHADGLALFAITQGREIGVDLERIRPDFATSEIAERFFSAQEVEALRALPANLQEEAFFNCWTRKEAYIKARGEGLSIPLDQFEVSLAPGQPASLLKTYQSMQEASLWSLHELHPGSGYVAALAVRGDDWQPKYWQWPE
jgi:4'-phosphopantetheinyl transferase